MTLNFVLEMTIDSRMAKEWISALLSPGDRLAELTCCAILPMNFGSKLSLN